MRNSASSLLSEWKGPIGPCALLFWSSSGLVMGKEIWVTPDLDCSCQS
uniref:Uncharacterized protein n=1 Tax=Fagus sylvatica TaxID=28930 RepID=A0A2N9GBA9_FAGSY